MPQWDDTDLAILLELWTNNEDHVFTWKQLSELLNRTHGTIQVKHTRIRANRHDPNYDWVEPQLPIGWSPPTTVSTQGYFPPLRPGNYPLHTDESDDAAYLRELRRPGSSPQLTTSVVRCIKARERLNKRPGLLPVPALSHMPPPPFRFLSPSMMTRVPPPLFRDVTAAMLTAIPVPVLIAISQVQASEIPLTELQFLLNNHSLQSLPGGFLQVLYCTLPASAPPNLFSAIRVACNNHELTQSSVALYRTASSNIVESSGSAAQANGAASAVAKSASMAANTAVLGAYPIPEPIVEGSSSKRSLEIDEEGTEQSERPPKRAKINEDSDGDLKDTNAALPSEAQDYAIQNGLHQVGEINQPRVSVPSGSDVSSLSEMTADGSLPSVQELSDEDEEIRADTPFVDVVSVQGAPVAVTETEPKVSYGGQLFTKSELARYEVEKLELLMANKFNNGTYTRLQIEQAVLHHSKESSVGRRTRPVFGGRKTANNPDGIIQKEISEPVSNLYKNYPREVRPSPHNVNDRFLNRGGDQSQLDSDVDLANLEEATLEMQEALDEQNAAIAAASSSAERKKLREAKAIVWAPFAPAVGDFGRRNEHTGMPIHEFAGYHGSFELPKKQYRDDDTLAAAQQMAHRNAIADNEAAKKYAFGKDQMTPSPVERDEAGRVYDRIEDKEWYKHQRHGPFDNSTEAVAELRRRRVLIEAAENGQLDGPEVNERGDSMSIDVPEA